MKARRLWSGGKIKKYVGTLANGERVMVVFNKSGVGHVVALPVNDKEAVTK